MIDLNPVLDAWYLTNGINVRDPAKRARDLKMLTTALGHFATTRDRAITNDRKWQSTPSFGTDAVTFRPSRRELTKQELRDQLAQAAANTVLPKDGTR